MDTWKIRLKCSNAVLKTKIPKILQSICVTYPKLSYLPPIVYTNNSTTDDNSCPLSVLLARKWEKQHVNKKVNTLFMKKCASCDRVL